ncbi:MAG: patatin-like phospholipase family protein [bacterium]
MFWLPFKKKKIGLVLSGGIARGIAHIGVLKVIEQYKIPISCIAATSSGSMIGAAYAAGLEVRLIEEIALRISWGRVLKLAFFRPGFISGEAIGDLLIKYIGDKKFSELNIPLACVGTDIKTGEAVVIKRGRVAKAVAASSAFPGVFAPEEIMQKTVVDGGLSNNVPVDVAKSLGANFVIACDVVPARPVQYIPKDPFQAFGRALDIVMHKMAVEQRKKANILIEPHLLDEDIWHLDLHKAKKMIAAGEAEAHKMLRHLRRK